MVSSSPVDPPASAALRQLLDQRIAFLDGAMGTMIQSHSLTEADFRGERFRSHPRDLKGNNDLLCLTQPEIIESIHRAYFAAGSDVVETNTFNATRISQADYGTEGLARELNRAAAEAARRAALAFMKDHPERRCFVAGALGPTNRTASMSPDVNNPAFRAITFDQLVDAYTEQVAGLVEGGVDALLIETVFDTLNCKAAIFAIENFFDNGSPRLPLMISVTITDASGRTLSGQTVEAFWNSVAHARPLSVGINCALGGRQMRPFLQELSKIADCYVSCYPNAGLPNAFGGYDESPEQMAAVLREFAESGWLNLVGGCCGSTPDHIRTIVQSVSSCSPRRLPSRPPVMRLSGLEPLVIG